MTTVLLAAGDGADVTLTLSENVYRPAEFTLSSSTTNSGAEYSNVRFNITLDGFEDFTGSRDDTFTITKVNGSTDTQGINDTFELENGNWVGYWGPEEGFTLSDPYEATTTFTVQMCDTGTAPLGNYDLLVELVDLTPEPDVILDTVSDSLLLSDDTLYVGTTEYEYQFTAIQAAIDAASSGDTINVTDGTYTYESEGEPDPAGLIKVTKPVAIKAADGVRPVIDGSGFDGVFKIHPSALNPGGTVIIEGFEITGDATTDIAITMQGCFDVTPAQVIIRDNWFHGMNAGIDFWGAGAHLPSGWTSAVAGVEITDNKFYDLGETGTAQGFGILLEGLADRATIGDIYAATVENNEFYNIYDGAGSDYGYGISANGGAANVYIDENSFTSISIGVALVNTDVANTRIINNNFTGTDEYGVITQSITGGSVNASDNWWGSDNGPEHAGNTFNVGSQGNKVSDNVDYCPWLDDEYPTGNSFAPVSLDGAAEYSSIQAAIDAATSTTIDVVAGTYTENIVVDKEGLILLGPNAGINPNTGTRGAEAVIQPAGAGSWPSVGAVSILNDNVTIDGFEMDGTTVSKNGINAYGASDVTVSNNIVHSITAGWDGIGILVWDWDGSLTVDGATIENNLVYDTGRMGIFCMDFGGEDTYALTTGHTIIGNVVHDTWTVGWGDAGGGIQINAGKDCSIIGNEVYDTQNGNRGIYMFGSGSGNTIAGNDVHNNPTGIQVWISGEGGTAIDWEGDAANSPSVRLNNIYDNTDFGAVSSNIQGENMILEAYQNWWGDNTGPQQGESNPDGKGNAVSANVNYMPWLALELQGIIDEGVGHYGFAMANLNTGWNLFSAPFALDSNYDQWGEFVALNELDDSPPLRRNSMQAGT